ncbi:hypothetical protein MUK42_32711 [Musa troglodytarum]|uniref:Uncharacterized protein n=1 Tax=Musa troglodytarum TaxID=320322 RepID=A0A9E7EXX2_9LILI|nr:hypothetical protein MUK42_32711 [Musa troglodytarum]
MLESSLLLPHRLHGKRSDGRTFKNTSLVYLSLLLLEILVCRFGFSL